MGKLLKKLASLAVFGVVAVSSSGMITSAAAEVRARMGNLAIDATLRSSLQPNTNYGVVKQTTAAFSVLHKGQPVTYRDTEGRTLELSFWQAWTLPDAPRPAILAANRATYLITEDNGEPRVQLLRGQSPDPARWQWLDVDGQVGKLHEVYILNSVDGPRELRGGSLLAISSMVMLDVKTLQTQSLDLEGSVEGLKQTGGYSAGNEKVVLMYSAAAKQVAMLARNQAHIFAVGSTSNPDFAMEAVSIGSNLRYAVPFDRNALRLADPKAGATPAWALANFEWRADAQGQQRLQQRKLSKPAPWLGRIQDPQLDSNSSRETTYILMPASEHMVGALATLIAREFGGKPLPALPDDPELVARIEVNGLPISLRYFRGVDDDPPKMHMTASIPVVTTKVRGKWKFSYEPEKIQATNRLIMSLAEKINAMLAKGLLQEYFTAMPKGS